jgi:hydroxymethylglutaryl-CoA lyase
MKQIVIHEVGPRDGLQVEKELISTLRKVAWIETILESGVDHVQLGSFVSAQRVPQMADTEELFKRFHGPRFSALVLNEKGFERGLACGVEFFCIGASASDTHSRRNTGMGTDEAMVRVVEIAQRALAAGARVQGAVQSAFGCGDEGTIARTRVMDMVRRYLDAGVLQISLADTAGLAHPTQVEDLFGEIWMLEPSAILACHFHDTYGMAMANCYAALRAGVQSFESAVGGLGGCPFTAVSGGNVATEDLVHMLQRMGLRDDLALAPLIDAARQAEAMVGRALPGKTLLCSGGRTPAAGGP